MRRAHIDRRLGPYRFVELRHEDIQPLRGFRNAQIDVLRQKQPLTADDQERWYRDVVVPTHAAEAPRFLLVSMLDAGDQFIGYGGLTNIDWDHRRAELSFLVDPRRAQDAELYAKDFRAFLEFVKEWAFADLGLNRLFSESYAFRDAHVALVEQAGFLREGRWREHVLDPHHAGKFCDSILHGMCARDWRKPT
jgi:RimJ/RimL family protein N-acetyltransferase